MRIMIKTIFLASMLAASVGISPSVKQPETKEISTQSEPIEIPQVSYKPVWTCPDCSPEEKYVLAELQEHTRITDRYAREGLEFLTIIAIVVVMGLFSGPQ